MDLNLTGSRRDCSIRPPRRDATPVDGVASERVCCRRFSQSRGVSRACTTHWKAEKEPKPEPPSKKRRKKAQESSDDDDDIVPVLRTTSGRH